MAGMLDRFLGKFLSGRKPAEDPGEGLAGGDQEQLLLLFEKRNALKREFAKTLDELAEIRLERDKLKKAQATDGVRLRGLEKLLADGANCQNAVLYYRLDTLWKSCHQMLRKRRDELESKYEELERTKLLEEFKAHAEQQQRQLEEKFRLVDEAYQEKASELAELQRQLARSQRFWHHFRRKRLVEQVLRVEEDMAPAISQREECLAELERVRDREPPAWKGLSVSSRREINLHLVAMAQYLVVHFGENDIAMLAKSTREKHPGEWRYGSNEECMGLMRPLRDIVAKLKSDDRRQERLQRRVSHLRDVVKYEGNAATVPDIETVARIEPSPGSSSTMDAVHADIPVNVIESGFWGLDALLLKPAETKKPARLPPAGEKPPKAGNAA